MNNDDIADLKQFITTTVSQQLILQTQELKEEIHVTDLKLSRKIDDLSGAVATAIEDSNQAVDKQLKQHETRITKLETV